MGDVVLEDVDGLRTAQAARRSGFRRRLVSAEEARDHWRVRDGALQHCSGSFFSLTGFRDPRDGSEHLLLYQPQGAATGFATRRLNGRRLYLVQARAEPGNVDEVQFGPSLQSTPANYMRLHGGATSPFAAWFIEHRSDVAVILETQQLDQGGRYAFKTKRAAILEAAPERPLATGFHWATPQALIAGAAEEYLLNTDFTASLAVSPWSADPADGELTPRSEVARASLCAPIRADVLGPLVVAASSAPRRRLEILPIEDLAGWQITDFGIEERAPHHGWSVCFLEVEADAREVARWIQPVIRAEAKGAVTLACRVRDGILEVRVPIAEEIGLANGRALGPTVLRYPGEDTTPPDWLAPYMDAPWIKTHVSDEGGRFLDHSSVHQLVMVPATVEPEEPGAWLTLKELKTALRMSNLCTIQLRCISALLLCAPDRS